MSDRPSVFDRDWLVNRAVELLSSYWQSPTTQTLARLAPIVVELRSFHTLADGRTDWSGRSPGYRQAMHEIYSRAEVPAEHLPTVQAALRYHVGNLLRENASQDELEAVGLLTSSPKERLARQRELLIAQRESAARPTDVDRLATRAATLLAHISVPAIPLATPGTLSVASAALEQVHRRSAELLDLIAEAKRPA